MSIKTADLMDRTDADLQSCTIQFQQFGGHRAFQGKIRTLQCREDNALVKQLLSTPGSGAVLVIDGAASLRTALLGDVLAGLAVANGWNGVIAYGAVRDSTALAGLAIGLKALGTNPRKSAKLGTGVVDRVISFGEVTFRPGEWVYADDDGVVVSPRPLH